ncbi:PREDICTED: stromelysin-3-like [Dinoponera quadriceps]|uniref:Stromelysin-3-like n=1 Tax=Dinoponera quadriceps TaxID=609295 RepID=A0A6P3Y4U4_DINQU|nr:PREDICTED: stromelysin-3-like [Dinoponera quadriceps]
MCPCSIDGPGGVLAHASFPNGDEGYVTEVHVDRAESWHIHISRNPPRTHSLLYVIAHEIGHTLGLHHSEHKDSIVFAMAPSKTKFPITLNFDDIFHIRYPYGANYHGSTTKYHLPPPLQLLLQQQQQQHRKTSIMNRVSYEILI